MKSWMRRLQIVRATLVELWLRSIACWTALTPGWIRVWDEAKNSNRMEASAPSRISVDGAPVPGKVNELVGGK